MSNLNKCMRKTVLKSVFKFSITSSVESKATILYNTYIFGFIQGNLSVLKRGSTLCLMESFN